jgi:hypothetical protein
MERSRGMVQHFRGDGEPVTGSLSHTATWRRDSNDGSYSPIWICDMKSSHFATPPRGLGKWRSDSKMRELPWKRRTVTVSLLRCFRLASPTASWHLSASAADGKDRSHLSWSGKKAMHAGLRWLVVIVLLSGCRGPQIGQEPPHVPAAEVAPVADTALQLEWIEARPRWERYGAEGALSFMPLEKCDSSIWPQLHTAIEQEIRRLPNPPRRAILQLRSFRVVILDKERLRAEQEEEMNWVLRYESDAQDDLLGSLLGTLFSTIIKLDLVLMRDGLFDVAQRQGWVKKPPRQLGEQYDPDITCDIKVDITLEWTGKRQEVELHSLLNGGPPTGNDSRYCGDRIQATIQGAIVNLVTEWRRKSGLPFPWARKRGRGPFS